MIPYVLFSFVTATWECFETPQWGKTLPENGARPFHFWLLDSWPLTWHPGPWSLSHTLNKTVWVWGIKTSDMFKSWKLNKLWDAMFRIWNMCFPWADTNCDSLCRCCAAWLSLDPQAQFQSSLTTFQTLDAIIPWIQHVPKIPKQWKRRNWWDLMRIPRVTTSIYINTILRYRKYE